MEGGTSHKKLKVSRGENWSLDDRKDLLEAIKIEIKTIRSCICTMTLTYDLHILFQMVEYVDAHFKTTNSSCFKANRRTHRCTDRHTD